MSVTANAGSTAHLLVNLNSDVWLNQASATTHTVSETAFASTIDGPRFNMLHDRKSIGIERVAEKIDVVISGHSHQPSIEETDGVLYLNPGSAGPRRFSLPITLALMEIEGGKARARIVEIVKE